MRVNEFASAEEQLELWKLVNQSVISAIEAQRQQQAQVNKAKAARARTKPGRLKRAAAVKRRGAAKPIPSTIPKTNAPAPTAAERPEKPDQDRGKTASKSQASLQKTSSPVSAPIPSVTSPAVNTQLPSPTSLPATNSAMVSTSPSNQFANAKPISHTVSSNVPSQQSQAKRSPKAPANIPVRQPRNSAMTGHVLPPQPVRARQQIAGAQTI